MRGGRLLGYTYTKLSDILLDFMIKRELTNIYIMILNKIMLFPDLDGSKLLSIVFKGMLLAKMLTKMIWLDL